MRVQGSTDPLGAHLLLNIIVPELPRSPPGFVIYTIALVLFRTIAKWHAVREMRLLVCDVVGVNVSGRRRCRRGDVDVYYVEQSREEVALAAAAGS